jgi:hypothetical protein
MILCTLNVCMRVDHHHESMLEVKLFLLIIGKLLFVDNCCACLEECFVLFL